MSVALTKSKYIKTVNSVSANVNKFKSSDNAGEYNCPQYNPSSSKNKTDLIWQRLTKIQRSFLVHGYVKITAVHIPQDLIILLLRCYDDILDWKLQKKVMEKFYQCENGKGLYGPSFTIANILFRLAIYPIGTRTVTQGHVEMVLISTHQMRPANIRSFVIYLELFNFETRYQFRKIIQCKIDKDSAVSHSCKWYAWL